MRACKYCNKEELDLNMDASVCTKEPNRGKYHEWIDLDNRDKQYNLITAVEDIYASGIEIIRKKNSDYATQDDPFKNFKSAQVLNVSVETAILIRTLDKMSRIGNVLSQSKTYVIDETVEDTILDAINYLAILLAYRRFNAEKTI